MTLEELISSVKDPKRLAMFIASSKHGVRIWDNGTLDITLDTEDSLLDCISSFECPVCASMLPVTSDNINDDIKGMFITCPECGQRYFFHKKVQFGGTPNTTLI